MARKKTAVTGSAPDYDAVLADVVGLVEAARHASVRTVNALIAATYWSVGRRIVEQEQHGAKRAGYGEELIVRLSGDLQSRFGRGFGRANLFQMRAFYLAHREILQIASGELAPSALSARVQTASGLFAAQEGMAATATRFPLPWSHYVRLLAVRNPEARRFYETEALRGGWTCASWTVRSEPNSTSVPRYLETSPPCFGAGKYRNGATRLRPRKKSRTPTCSSSSH